MTNRSAAYVDYQQRASEFVIGDLVFPFEGGNSEVAGRVMALYPAIGMVDVEWPHGSQRLPVEDLQRVREDHQHNEPAAVGHDNVPGGGVVSVPGGPVSLAEGELAKELSSLKMKTATRRVAEAFVRKSLATGVSAFTSGDLCPKCKTGLLKKAAYQRRSGNRENLYGCPNCMLIVKASELGGL